MSIVTIIVAVASLFTAHSKPAPRNVEVIVDKGQYTPAELPATPGEHLTLTFVKKDYSGCTREVVFPTLGKTFQLPTNKPVVVDLGEVKAGEIPFHCGMKMVHGKVVVTPRE